MTDPTKELAFQNDVIEQMEAAGWKLGEPLHQERHPALISAGVTGKTTSATVNRPLSASPDFLSSGHMRLNSGQKELSSGHNEKSARFARSTPFGRFSTE